MYLLSNKRVASLGLCLALLLSISACADSSSDSEEASGISATELRPAEEIGELIFKPFVSQSYSLSTEIPEDWTQSLNELEGGLPVINFVPKTKIKPGDLPISMQTTTSLSHIDIHPQGHGSGYPIGRNHRLVLFEGSVPSSGLWDHERSRVYVLGNGEVWAYLLYPKSAPQGWTEDGFVFAQIAIENFSSDCFDDITNQRKDMDKCKPLEGDEVLYYGRLNVEDQRYVLHALEALELRS